MNENEKREAMLRCVKEQMETEDLTIFEAEKVCREKLHILDPGEEREEALEQDYESANSVFKRLLKAKRHWLDRCEQGRK